MDLFLTLFTWTPNIFEGRSMCLDTKKTHFIFSLIQLLSGSGLITLKTLGEWQNDRIYKVKATIYQGRFTICALLGDSSCYSPSFDPGPSVSTSQSPSWFLRHPIDSTGTLCILWFISPGQDASLFAW